jgi:hypothetical protein
MILEQAGALPCGAARGRKGLGGRRETYAVLAPGCVHEQSA